MGKASAPEGKDGRGVWTVQEGVLEDTWGGQVWVELEGASPERQGRATEEALLHLHFPPGRLP